MKEGEQPVVEWHEDDQPDGVTFSLPQFALDTWNAAFLAEYKADCEYVKKLKALPKGQRPMVDQEIKRIAAKWYRPQEETNCQQQQKRKKPRNYTNYDVGGDDE